MDVKFTQLYWFSDNLFALDEDGYIWEFLATLPGSLEIDPHWVELPHAKRTVPEQKSSGNVVKPLTPKEIQDKAYKEAQDSVTSEIKEYGR